MPGTGVSGSMCRWLSATGGAGANMSISGSSARNGASTSEAYSAPPTTAPSITTKLRPRTISGISGTGGTCRIRIDVVAVSGASRVHACQAWKTSRARSHGHSIAPA